MDDSTARRRGNPVPARFALVLLAVLAGCGGRPAVRPPTDRPDAPDAAWTAADSRQVAAALVGRLLAGSWVEDFSAEQGKKPTLAVGAIRDDASGSVAVETLVLDLERQLADGGRVLVVTSPATEADRGGRDEGPADTGAETPARWARRKGADFLLTAVIGARRDRAEGRDVTLFRVDCALVDLADGTTVWNGAETVRKPAGVGGD